MRAKKAHVFILETNDKPHAYFTFHAIDVLKFTSGLSFAFKIKREMYFGLYFELCLQYLLEVFR